MSKRLNSDLLVDCRSYGRDDVSAVAETGRRRLRAAEVLDDGSSSDVNGSLPVLRSDCAIELRAA